MKFEDKLKKLETIVKSLENGNISLSEAADLYAEGVAAAADCKKEIDEAKLKIVVKEGQ